MSEPAIKARLSPTNQALFETTDDYLLWTAQITRFDQFDRYFRMVNAKGVSIRFYKDARDTRRLDEVEAVLKKTLCTDGRTLLDVMREKGQWSRYGSLKRGLVSG